MLAGENWRVAPGSKAALLGSPPSFISIDCEKTRIEPGCTAGIDAVDAAMTSFVSPRVGVTVADQGTFLLGPHGYAHAPRRAAAAVTRRHHASSCVMHGLMAAS